MTFPVGVTSVSFNVTIKNDSVMEDIEFFMLEILKQQEKNVMLGKITFTTVTIVDLRGSGK